MKTAIITGASRGIGRQTAIEFSKAGYRVIINYNRSESDALALKAELSHSHIFKADMKDNAQIKAMFDFVKSRFGGVDVLVNNAGISHIGVFQLMSEEEIEALIKTNLTAAIICSKYATEQMMSKKSGCIINISSMWGEVGASCEVVYSASKAGLIGLTKALAKEVGQSGIRVNSISPGVIDTDMNSSLDSQTLEELKADIPLRRIGTPQEIAKIALFLASPDASYLNGINIGANGGLVI
ncbi:MAG: 3-oxoacyl-ACP reductase FabG [Ruminococcus sp.]|nr:3-oxoacyl-ACP reductase FabG [Ruminococcus sp.]